MELLKFNDVLRVLNISKMTLLKLIKNDKEFNHICFKIGNQWRFDEKKLNTYLEKKALGS